MDQIKLFFIWLPGSPLKTFRFHTATKSQPNVIVSINPSTHQPL